MIVVSDTTPIISLLKIDQLDLLHKLFGSVMIPDAVYDELTSNPQYVNEANLIIASEYICKVSVAGSESVKLLQRATGLDRGESEAIIYTDECHADLLLMDEAKGRQVARQMGIRIMGTIGILLQAYQSRLLNKEQILCCIDIMRASGRQISEGLYRQLLNRLEQ